VENTIYLFKSIFKYAHYILFWFSFIIPKDTTRKSQILDKKPINNPIQGRCY